MDPKTIGENIRKARKKGKYSQKQFATAIGVSSAALSAYEIGKTSPDMDVIIRMAVLLQTTTDEVMGVKEPEL